MFIHQIKDNRLFIGGVGADELIQQYGSPLYVYDENILKERYLSLENAIRYKHKRIHYAMKANTNPHILEIFYKMGAYIDAVSPGEIEIALRTGFPPNKILYTGNNITEEELKYAIDKQVRLNIGSLYTLERYGKLYPGGELSVRINPNIGAGHHDHTITGGPDTQFGIFENDLPKIKELIGMYKLKLKGVHCHIGSGILDVSKFIEVMKIMIPLAKRFDDLEFIDFGGGIGVPYHPTGKDFDIKLFGQQASRYMEDFSKLYGKDVILAIEPGRYLVAEAGVLLTTIHDIKKTPKFTFVGVDTGFNHLIRPMAYGSFHQIVNASHVAGEEEGVVVNGYLCETGDIFTRTPESPTARSISRPQIGDILAILTTGAYGYSMASQYNSRTRPAEVMVNNGNSRLIRRRETFDDLLSTLV